MNTRGNMRQLKRAIKDLAVYQDIYINAINLTPSAIETLRTMVRDGILEPDVDMVIKSYKNVHAVMSGDVIIPQMTYTKRKEF